MTYSVLLIGATGLVGSHTLKQLLQNDAVREVKIIVRRTTGVVHPKLRELIINFDFIQDHEDFIKCDVFISCLGSTIKKAGSKDKFRLFDLEYPLQIARICQKNGCTKMILLSALGANSGSSIFYNRIKGMLEDECKKTGFRNLVIIQPSLIIGDRKEKRAGEKFATIIMNLLDPITPVKYKSVKAATLASTINFYVSHNNDDAVITIWKNNFVENVN